MPEDEIQVKIGGDHGGGSFKMAYQIANVERPNAANNTVAFCLFEAKEYKENLVTALTKFAEQINELRETKWRGKRICVFMMGDYKFLCSVYGLSGASGK